MKQKMSPEFREYAALAKKINLFCFPLMLTGILQLIYNTADTIIIGQFASSASLAAVGSTTHIVFLLITMFNGVSIGANFLVSRYYGAQDDSAVSQTVHCAAILSVVLGVAGGMFGFFLSTPILRLVSTPPEVLLLSSLYLKIYFIGIPALVVYNFGAAILRSVGDTRYPLLFMFLSGAVNVGLNLLLVVEFQMDVAGVAIATSVSELLSAILVTIRLCTMKECCRLDFKKIHFYPDKALGMIQVGLSAGIQGVIFSIANVLIQSQINSFGVAAMAGNSAAASLENFVHTAQNAYYQSAITFTSRALGARKPKQAVRVFWTSILSATALGLVLCGLLDIFRLPLLNVFVRKTDTAYEQVMLIGCMRVAMIGRFQWVGGLMETACGSLRGLGKTINPTATSLIGCCLLRVVWVATIFALFSTLQSLYLSYPVSWIVTFLVHMGFLVWWYRKESGLFVPKVPA